VFRQRDAQGRLLTDTVALATESLPGEPLLVEVMRNGRATQARIQLQDVRDACGVALRGLPPQLRELTCAAGTPFAAHISGAVRAMAAQLDAARAAHPEG